MYILYRNHTDLWDCNCPEHLNKRDRVRSVGKILKQASYITFPVWSELVLNWTIDPKHRHKLKSNEYKTTATNLSDSIPMHRHEYPRRLEYLDELTKYFFAFQSGKKKSICIDLIVLSVRLQTLSPTRWQSRRIWHAHTMRLQTQLTSLFENFWKKKNIYSDLQCNPFKWARKENYVLNIKCWYFKGKF